MPDRLPRLASETLVVVTGATGFIASHCVLQLLQAGYQVRGTVRSIERGELLRSEIAKHCDAAAHLSFAQADLKQESGWTEAMAGAQFALHVASPLPTRPTLDEEELIIPARDGALRVLRAALAAGLERVVMTSSISAILTGNDRNRVFDESDWSNLDKAVGAYNKSKTIAEKAAWSFMSELAESSKLELAVINPGMVFGPLLTSAGSVSLEVIRKLMAREMPGVPDLRFAPVDVRDVATAHLLAMTAAQAAGKRFIVANASISYREIAVILHQHFASRGYKIPLRAIPKWLVRIVAHFDKTIGLILDEIGLPAQLSSDRARDLLGWKSRSTKDMIIETGESLIEWQQV